jgi:peptidoglycan/LPS O-acetylase OafA/YrhL
VLLLIGLLVLADRQFSAWFSTSAIPHNLTASSFVRTLLLANRWWSPTDGDWNQPEWSLSVEILGYVAFPVIALIATRIRDVRVLIGLAVVCLMFPTVYAFVSHGKLFNDDIFWGAGTRMAGAFTGGVVLARLHRLTPESWRDAQGSIGTWALAALGACLVMPPFGYGALTLCFGVLVYGLASGRGIANGMFSTPTAVWLGEISFPLYLVHVMVLMWLRYALFQDHPGLAEKLGATGLAIMFIFSLAWLLHIYVERPSHRFARKAVEPPDLGAPARAASSP